MRSFPLPVRVAAGLAATALEQTRRLPTYLVSVPVTVASQALQLSMRVQQQVTELAIKGDEALTWLDRPEDQPEWAVFDEDDMTGAPTTPAATSPPTSADEPAQADSLPQDYDEMTVAQLRGKLRQFSVDDLARILDYERTHGDRPEFVRMLSNRLTRLRGH